MNNIEQIKGLNLSTTRLLLACDACSRITDLPCLVERAGLSRGQYIRAFALLEQYGFLEYRDGSMCPCLRTMKWHAQHFTRKALFWQGRSYSHRCAKNPSDFLTPGNNPSGGGRDP